MGKMDVACHGFNASEHLKSESEADDNVFHKHLDVCSQCEEHPFDLCREGARLLEVAGAKAAEELRSRAGVELGRG
jgi:hypothetical protein